MRFSNLRVTDKFEKSSCEMIRVADMLGAMQKKPAANYEYQAALEYCTKGGLDYFAQENGYKF